MIRISQIKVRPEQGLEAVEKKACQMLGIPREHLESFQIIKKSIDARKKPDIFYSYTVLVKVPEEERLVQRKKDGRILLIEPEKYSFPKSGNKRMKERPVIVGSGPAGLFCAYFLARAGYCPLVLERGMDVDSRQKEVEAFWQGGALNPESNVQFGEGGAGTFSDGKLNTLVKDKEGRSRAVLETFVRFGAGEDILYESKPHIGTDVLSGVVKNMRLEIERLGGTVRFHSKVTNLFFEQGRICGLEIGGRERIEATQVVLAIGHSARDTFQMLYKNEVPMEAKAFAVGLRVEHPQEMINISQYGTEYAKRLPAAPYKLAAKTEGGRGVYSFCMCPGGYVVNASSEPDMLAVNGMSYSGRDGENANSAIIVSVTPKDFESANPLAGIAYQQKLEQRAYEEGRGKIPCQYYGEFKRLVLGGNEAEEGVALETAEQRIIPQTRGKTVFARVDRILPMELNRAFVEGMEQFAGSIKGFNRSDAVLSGVESRTSSPVRIIRNFTFQSTAAEGLYPCGEGAGYAGGIMSAAMDGMRVAEYIASEYKTLDETVVF